MKLVLFALVALNLVDLVVMPFMTAKCRSGAMLDKYSSWLPFNSLYKVLILVEFFLIRDNHLTLVWMAGFFSILYIINSTVFVRALAGGSGYTPKDPITRTMQDILELKEHRFYPVHAFDAGFWLNVLIDNWERFVADAMFVLAISQILHLL